MLGCTHYPLLTAVISYVMGDDVTLVSSAEETAKDVYRVLADADLLRPDDLPPPDHGFTTTGDPDEFRRLASRFLGVGSRLGPVFTAPPHAHDGGAGMRVTVVGCSGSFAGPRVARVVATSCSTRPTGAPGTSCSTSAAAPSGRCSGTCRPTTSTPSCSATCTPTTASTCAGSTSPAATAPPARCPPGCPCTARPARPSGSR